jgi:hypothetical protein
MFSFTNTKGPAKAPVRGHGSLIDKLFGRVICVMCMQSISSKLGEMSESR